MTYDEIIEKEKRETNEDLFKIHLYLENDWWRGYEWSAYLCRLFPNELEDKNKLKPTHKESKTFENGIILVGLKLSSFEKYLPNATIINVDNKHILIDVKDYIENEFTIETYVDTLNKWKEAIPFNKSDSNPKANKCIIKEPSKESIMSIMQEVLAYPIENKTLIENTTFIGHLKSELIKLI